MQTQLHQEEKDLAKGKVRLTRLPPLLPLPAALILRCSLVCRRTASHASVRLCGTPPCSNTTSPTPSLQTPIRHSPPPPIPSLPPRSLTRPAVQKKTNLTAEDLEQHAQMVDLVSKHIGECEQLEKKRYQSRTGGKGGSALTGGAGGRGGTQMTEIKRSAEATDLDPIDLDPEVRQVWTLRHGAWPLGDARLRHGAWSLGDARLRASGLDLSPWGRDPQHPRNMRERGGYRRPRTEALEFMLLVMKWVRVCVHFRVCRMCLGLAERAELETQCGRGVRSSQRGSLLEWAEGAMCSVLGAKRVAGAGL